MYLLIQGFHRNQVVHFARIVQIVSMFLPFYVYLLYLLCYFVIHESLQTQKNLAYVLFWRTYDGLTKGSDIYD